ncbi:MAG: hypothetical protein EBX92_09120 [Actinobacteria bacterium]|nr:hypothetical protein [Actinomycetota bacterium]
MQGFSGHDDRVGVRVEVVQFNLHRTHRLVIGGLRQGSDGKWELPGDWVGMDEEPVDTARRVIGSVFRLPVLLHEPVFVGFRRSDHPAPAVSLTFTSFGLVPNTVLEWSKFDIVGPRDLWTASNFAADRLVGQARERIIDVAAELPVLARALAAQRTFDFFTIPELQTTYEWVLGHQIDAANFRRKVMAVVDFLLLVEREELGNLNPPLPSTEGKPPSRYRCGRIERLDPPIRFER